MRPERKIGLQVFYFVITSTLIGLRFWALRIRNRRNSGTSPTSNLRPAKSWANITSNVAILLVFLISLAAEIILIRTAIKGIRYRGSSEVLVPTLGVPLDEAVGALKFNFLSKFVYHSLIWLCKAAFIAFYFELLRYMSTKVKRLLYVATAYTALAYVSCIILTAAWCRPVERNWSLAEDGCSPFQSITSVSIQTFFNVSTDIIIMVIPITLIRRPGLLHTREKSGLALLFLLGVLTIATALIRYGILNNIIEDERNTLVDGEPVETYELLGQVECLMAFFATCMPSLRILLFKFRAGMDAEKWKRSLMERMNDGSNETLNGTGSRRAPFAGGHIHTGYNTRRDGGREQGRDRDRKNRTSTTSELGSDTNISHVFGPRGLDGGSYLSVDRTRMSTNSDVELTGFSHSSDDQGKVISRRSSRGNL